MNLDLYVFRNGMHVLASSHAGCDHNPRTQVKYHESPTTYSDIDHFKTTLIPTQEAMHTVLLMLVDTLRAVASAKTCTCAA